MRNSIITVIGTPKSGISILGQCLRMLGMTSLDDHAETDTSTIHGLLFQDLDHSPTMAGPFPQGWMQSPGAERARQRIEALIAACRNETGSLFLADPFLCRFMSLWTEAFQEAGLASRFVLMVRHPWEAAPSLAGDENLDLAKAHLLWLAHVTDALRACQDQGHVLVTFDQLLADPVSTLVRIGTESDLTWPNDPWSVSSLLLDFVQPNLKRHHISNLPDKDKHSFQAYERLYQEIRRGQWSGEAKGIIPVQSPTTAGPDLVESLLDVVGQYEKRAASRQAEQERIAAESGPPLFAQVVFPSTREGGEVVETIPLIADEWQHITLPVPEPTLLKDKPIIFKPLNTNGTVKISAISLINRVTGNSVWSAKTSNEFDQIVVQGSAVRLPAKENFILLVTGNGPFILFPKAKDVFDFPVQYTMWIKPTRGQAFVQNHLFPVAYNLQNFVNTLSIHLQYNMIEEINTIISLIDSGMLGRACVSDYLHVLYLLKKFMGKECKVYVELGTLFSGSICLLMQQKAPCTFVGIDLFDGYYGQELDIGTKLPVNLETAKKNINAYNVHKHEFNLIQGSSYESDTVMKFKNLNLNIDLLFIDGDHSYKGVTKDYEAYKRFVNPGGFIVFDNYGDPNVWKEVAVAISDIDFDNDGFEEIGQYGFSYIVRKI